jgi:hypothetical protein
VLYYALSRSLDLPAEVRAERASRAELEAQGGATAVDGHGAGTPLEGAGV